MQAGSLLTLSPSLRDSYTPSSDEFAEDLRLKMNICDENLKNEDVQENQEDEEEEFSFVCTNPDGSPASADEVFDNGQIRPIVPFFNQDLLFPDAYDGSDRDGSSSPLQSPVRKLFVEQHTISSSPSPSPSPSSEPEDLNGESEGPYCDWSAKTAVELSSEKCKKSNSTGFSKLWRFRDLIRRSSSDGKDAFVFLNPSSTGSFRSEDTSSGVEKNGVVRKVKAGAKAREPKTASSAHEKHYVMNRTKRESDKRKSYLPYKQNLVGFFTNVNGLSRNIHPF